VDVTQRLNAIGISACRSLEEMIARLPDRIAVS
jgi:hypothetical protein